MHRNRDVQISKTLSYILRHSAEKEGIPIQPDGFVDLDQLLQHKQLKLKQTNFSDIQRIVAENDKNRFTLIKSNDGRWKIKANQGHSLAEVNELSLQKLDKIEHPVVHGTYYRFWHNNIKQEGLKRMNRNHIHFACTDKIDYDAKTVISGFRKNAEVLIYVDTAKAIMDGILFYRSENNVILSDGLNGVIPLKYFEKAVDRKTGNKLQG